MLGSRGAVFRLRCLTPSVLRLPPDAASFMSAITPDATLSSQDEPRANIYNATLLNRR